MEQVSTWRTDIRAATYVMSRRYRLRILILSTNNSPPSASIYTTVYYFLKVILILSSHLPVSSSSFLVPVDFANNFIYIPVSHLSHLC